MKDLCNHYQIYLNGNKLYRNYKSVASANKAFLRLASDTSTYVELWYTDDFGKRILVAYEN